MTIEVVRNNKKKISILFIIYFLLFNEYNGFVGNKTEYYYKQYLCSLLIYKAEDKCINEVFNDYDFFYFVKNIRKNVNLSIDIKKISLIEHIFIIIGIIPFIKNNSIINYSINSKESKHIFEILFNYNKIKNRKIFIDFNDFKEIKKKFNSLINYKFIYNSMIRKYRSF